MLQLKPILAVPRLVTLAAALLSVTPGAAANPGAPIPVDAARLAREAIRVEGKLVAAYRLQDRDGERILVLSRKASPSREQPDSGREERIDLAAAYYLRGAAGQWQQEWTIRDGSDCPGLDVDADFFVSEITFTDLNRDGRIEVTVPYRYFCGGGIDPHVVKVILREGATKLAIRGESLVRYPGQEGFGGAHRHDQALLAPQWRAYKQHLDAVWRRVSIDKRG